MSGEQQRKEQAQRSSLTPSQQILISRPQEFHPFYSPELRPKLCSKTLWLTPALDSPIQCAGGFSGNSFEESLHNMEAGHFPLYFSLEIRLCPLTCGLWGPSVAFRLQQLRCGSLPWVLTSGWPGYFILSAGIRTIFVWCKSFQLCLGFLVLRMKQTMAERCGICCWVGALHCLERAGRVKGTSYTYVPQSNVPCSLSSYHRNMLALLQCRMLCQALGKHRSITLPAL